MEEQKKKRKWWKVLLVIVIVIALAGVGVWKGMEYMGKQAIKKVESKVKSGELKIPENIEIPQEVLEQLPELIAGFENQPATKTAKGEQTESKEEKQSEVQEQTQEQMTQQSSQSSGTVNYNQGVDLSYASAIASVASGADVAAAYSAVLGCLSAADKAQIAAYLASGQDGAAYSLVASRITGDAYATLLSLYYKYLPMVQ
ncbi:MAG: hypothetical protein E7399_01365 [Ruminococcaceae bacterium]|nr:hypothetical protein [Oscillospiraceae bacterium]